MAANNVKAERTYRVVLVGDSLAGKSSLLTSFVPNQCHPNLTSPSSTTIPIDDKMIELFLIEAPVTPDFDRLRPLCYHDIQIVLICFNVDEPRSLDSVIEKWYPEIRHFCAQCVVVLVACKIDLRDDPDIILKLKQRGEKPTKTKTGKKLASKIHADAYVECSARTREGVQELFTTAVRLTLKKPHHLK